MAMLLDLYVFAGVYAVGRYLLSQDGDTEDESNDRNEIVKEGSFILLLFTLLAVDESH